MKHLLITFSLLLTSGSWSKEVNYMDLVIRNGLHYEKFTDEPFTGKVVGFEKGYIKAGKIEGEWRDCLLYTSPSPRDRYGSRMPSSA